MISSCENIKNGPARYRIQILKERYPGSYLLEYHEMAIDGDIKIGRELKLQIDNLLDDLDNPDYYFDRSDAEFRIEFIEKFCKHTKSPFYGMPFILELWEKALIEAFYSFKCTDGGLRRFKKMILLIARKNGKSTLSAAIALTEFVIGGGGVDVVCSSNDDPQADIIFQEIDNMRERFDPKDKRTRKNLKGIFHKKNKSTIKKMSDRTRNKEGRNIDVGILDEVHEMKTNIIGKSIEQSQSTKDEPILIMITTEGFVSDGYLDDQLKYARKVLAGDIDDPTLLVWLYTQDSENEIWSDPSSWQKSNPSLGLIKKPKFLKDQLKLAQHIKSERMFTMAKDFNIKQSNGQAWLLESEYINKATFNIEDLRGAIGVGGVDLAETTDLACAKALVMRPGSNIKYMITKYFIPEAKIEAGEIEDKKNYLEWAREGLIEVTPGNENDFAKITEWFIELNNTYGIAMYKIGYDNALAKFWVDEMKGAGFEMERVNMEKKILSNPMKLVEADLKSGLINYNDNPIDRWCLGNTAIKIDEIGQIMPVKVNDTRNRRIDGSLAQIICHAVYTRFRTEYLSNVR